MVKLNKRIAFVISGLAVQIRPWAPYLIKIIKKFYFPFSVICHSNYFLTILYLNFPFQPFWIEIGHPMLARFLPLKR
jgi:hypothetical protein